MKIITVLFMVILTAGCSNRIDPLAVMEMEQQNLRLFYASLQEVTYRPIGMSDFEAVAYQTRMASLQGELKEVAPRTAQTVMEWDVRKDEQVYRWVSLGFNNPFTQAWADKWAGKKYGAGVTIGGKDADMRGMRFDFANDGSTIAKDEAVAATNDSQAMRDPEKSQQTRSTSRPLFQPDPDTSGGSGDESPGAPIFNESEGFGFDGDLL